MTTETQAHPHVCIKCGVSFEDSCNAAGQEAICDECDLISVQEGASDPSRPAHEAIGPGEWLEDVLGLMTDAREAIWKRTQRGNFRDPGEAASLVKVHEHLEKALGITSKELAQYPMPETPLIKTVDIKLGKRAQ